MIFSSQYETLTTDQWLEGIANDVDQWILDEIKTENLEANLR